MFQQALTRLRSRLTMFSPAAARSADARHGADLVNRVMEKKLTYLSEAKLRSIAASCREIDRLRVPGCAIEAGCALGGSAIVIVKSKQLDRPLRVFDVFGQIPPPTAEDPPEVHERYKVIREGRSEGIGGDAYYGYESNLLDRVINNFNSFGISLEENAVEFIQGLIDETMVIDGPVAFAHIDLDWYAPVSTSLKRIVPWLSDRGSIILDDYHYYGGCRRAVDEYFAQISDDFLFNDSAGAMKITRQRSSLNRE